MKYFNILYNSFLWSLVIALTSFKSEWLEMRMNIGLLLFGVWIALFIILSLISIKKTLNMSFIFSIINLIVCLGYLAVLYGIERLSIVPASIIREGLNMTSVSFNTINTVLIVFLLVGLVIIFFTSASNKKRRDIFS
ncbi:hypothetical protein [Clostridium cylindrosporum]|uniref:Uncharacterized protein n=1 Tax=Clostridium cylindrosporum DSM 605 TaxID=1121307 RepID=A0A0J8DE99_CLOCY|nr:hypothetical protein [Clostridium cylindrosporum]KMT22513.1 hypothetical protein CLCY_10c00580 [Clostridium cylindrosporum DSM 605]